MDLLAIHQRILPLGAVISAAAGKALGFTPEGIINEIRRNSHYTEADFRRVDSDPPVDPVATMKRLREVLKEAEEFVIRIPTDKIGLFFLEAGRVVQPDPERLDDYQAHPGKNRGGSIYISSMCGAIDNVDGSFLPLSQAERMSRHLQQ